MPNQKNNMLKGTSAFTHAKEVLTSVWSNHRKLVIGCIIASAVLGLMFSGFITQINLRDSNRISDISFLMCIPYGFVNVPLSFLMAVLMIAFFWKLMFSLYRPSTKDEEHNLEISDSGVAGTAHKMNREELEDAFKICTFEDTDFIVGANLDNPEELLSIKRNWENGLNGNILIVGSPGSLKSRGFVVPFIMHCIRNRESAIISDPKLELYRKTASLARAHEINVKVLNLKPRTMAYSDSCNYMAQIGNNDTVALSFAHSIIVNATDAADLKDFWTEGAENLLAACVLYVNNDDYNLEYEKSMAGIFEMLSTNTPDTLAMKFVNISDNMPVKKCFNIYNNGDKGVVKANTLTGLAIKLQKLINTTLGKVIGIDDIDMALPGKEPCLYFLGFDDADSSMQMFSATFFKLITQVLYNEADNNPNGELDVKTTFVYEELPSIGRIPDLQNVLSTSRSRNIDNMLFVQNLSQLQEMFKENWETIVDDCSTQIILRTNTLTTAKHFSERSGEETVMAISQGYNASSADPLDVHPEYLANKRPTVRYVYTPHEILTMKPSEMLVCISSCNVIKMQKIDYEEYPMADEIIEEPIWMHKPKWACNLTAEERDLCGITDDTYKTPSTQKIKILPPEAYKVTREERQKIIAERRAKLQEEKRKKKQEYLKQMDEKEADNPADNSTDMTSDVQYEVTESVDFNLENLNHQSFTPERVDCDDSMQSKESLKSSDDNLSEDDSIWNDDFTSV